MVHNCCVGLSPPIFCAYIGVIISWKRCHISPDRFSLLSILWLYPRWCIP